MIRMIFVALFCAGALLAQDGEKVTVPLPDPSRPPQIHANLLAGGITVRGADIRDVEVEAHSRGHEQPHPRPPGSEGMKQLDLPGNAGLNIDEDNNVVNIKTNLLHGPVDLVITVPRHSSLELRCINGGGIHVEQVDGEIDANDLNGSITLQDVSGSVVAHSLNGELLVVLNRIDPAKPMSFSTLNGNIDVTLPANAGANLRMKTDNGDIYSDFDVKLDSGASIQRTESGNRQQGKYHISLNRTLRGTINGGGPELQFTTFNGQIYIRKGK